MNKENNFEVKSIDLDEMDNIVKIKDDEMKHISGGMSTSDLHGNGNGGHFCIHRN